MLRDPPPPRELKPSLMTLAAGRRLVRVHRPGAPLQFNEGGSGGGRFHPLRNDRGSLVPTLYAGATLPAALLETLFRLTSAGRNPNYLPRARVTLYEYTRLTVRRPLSLIDLRGLALRRLDLSRAPLLDGGPDTYPATARWAEALHHAAPKASGMIWLSRQLDTTEAFVFFADRLRRPDLEADSDSHPLGSGRGFERVLTLAAALGVVITEP